MTISNVLTSASLIIHVAGQYWSTVFVITKFYNTNSNKTYCETDASFFKWTTENSRKNHSTKIAIV